MTATAPAALQVLASADAYSASRARIVLATFGQISRRAANGVLLTLADKSPSSVRAISCLKSTARNSGTQYKPITGVARISGACRMGPCRVSCKDHLFPVSRVRGGAGNGC